MRRSTMFLLASALVFVGCNGSAVEEISGAGPPAYDGIALNQVVPAVTDSVARGVPVTFGASVRYSLATAATGQVFLELANQGGVLLKQPVALTVRRGDGFANIADQLVIPSDGVTSVKVVYSLWPSGATQTTVLVSYVYPVS
jgi:hypothetical protein